ncbi:unnamed protein product [Mytilus edulis]|uniref:GIY-YIG domain-containing protein n=1 Tax=Mytilus edulis TaxID=6550 RepID=A0A8S3QUB3_MYTED|nr:unnamed protein product [Mytilus edulis]
MGTTEGNVQFIITHHPYNPTIRKIINQRKDILERSPETYHMSRMKFDVTTRKTTSLRQLLVNTDIKPLNPKGNRPCGRNCHICTKMTHSTEIKATQTEKTIKITEPITCLTTSVIYIIKCKKCNKQYIGQTGNTICERFYGHMNDIKNKNEHKPVSKHFSAEGHNTNDVTITGIKTTVANVNTRLRTEEAYINYLSTQSPWGLNLRR